MGQEGRSPSLRRGAGGSRGWCGYGAGTRDAAGRGRPARSLPAALDRRRRVKGRALRSWAPWVALDPSAAEDNDQRQPGG